MRIIDGHLDLAWNALAFDRDQTQPVAALREREASTEGKGRGRNTVSLPELRNADIGVCLATLLARARPDRRLEQTPSRTDLDYTSQTVACAMALGQLAYYELLESQGEMRMIRTPADLDDAWAAGERDDSPIGFILSMEGADPIVSPDHAAMFFERGLRTASLAHYGQSAYAHGTGGDGPLTDAGIDLLRAFEQLGIVLDLTHTAETAFWQALERFQGRVFASHNNCRALVPGDRQFSDDQLRALIERDGVIGAVLDAWMLKPGYVKGETPERDVPLTTVVDHIDHVCQIAGNANHAAIGSDLDGGFGAEQTPDGLETIADLQRLAPLLKDRGYDDAAIASIFHGNWLRFFRAALPASPGDALAKNNHKGIMRASAHSGR